jgi:hypothetical protein
VTTNFNLFYRPITAPHYCVQRRRLLALALCPLTSTCSTDQSQLLTTVFRGEACYPGNLSTHFNLFYRPITTPHFCVQGRSMLSWQCVHSLQPVLQTNHNFSLLCSGEKSVSPGTVTTHFNLFYRPITAPHYYVQGRSVLALADHSLQPVPQTNHNSSLLCSGERVSPGLEL